jgi:ABC-type siderophore export system fused ATPase/permease subunit
MLDRLLPWVRGLSVGPFILVMTAAAFLVKIIAAVPAALFAPTGATDMGMAALIEAIGLPLTLLAVAVVTPLGETAIGQWLPIRVGRLFTQRWLVLLAGSCLLFGTLHLLAGLLGFLTGVATGVVFAASYLRWETVSRWRAYWVTCTIHGLHNLVAMAYWATVS